MSQRCNEYWTLYEKLCARDNINSTQIKQKMQEHLRACPQCAAWWREVRRKCDLAPVNVDAEQKGITT